MNQGNNQERMQTLRGLIRDVPDFPQPGVLFRDITPLLADPRGLNLVTDAFAAHFSGESVNAIVGIESRGFIFGAPLAARLGLPFIPVRKPGKLPGPVDRVAYSLEYGTAEIQMHKGSLAAGARVVVVDDLLATGGTALAAAELVRRQGANVVALAFVIELAFFAARAKIGDTPVYSLLTY
jgi:adenine phosphoribosyltransferase